MAKPKVHLVEIHSRLFADDVARLKKRAAEKRIGWQVELRLLVHKALQDEGTVNILEVHPGGKK